MWFIAQKKILLTIAALIVGGSVAIISFLGLPLGIDFTGGALTEVSYAERPAEAVVDEQLSVLGPGCLFTP